MKTENKISKSGILFLKPFLTALTLLLIVAACSDSSTNTVDDGPNEPEEPEMLDAKAEHTFDGPVFDISATGNGTILVADMGVVKEIDANGVTEITTLPLVEGAGAFGADEVTFINGLLPLSDGNFYASRSALDLAVGSGVLFSDGNSTELAADIEAFTMGDWPDGDYGHAPHLEKLQLRTSRRLLCSSLFKSI